MDSSSCLLRRGLAVAIALPFAMSACVVLVQQREVEELPPTEPVEVRSPVRVFLADGSLAVFPDGATITGSTVRGEGRLYDLLRQDAGSAGEIPLDSILGIEAFDRETDPGASVLVSIVATAAAAVGTALAAVAIFGSCPTIYTFDGDTEFLEAEAFSYSISPLLEGRDVDELSVRADAAGIVRLEIRNEALETHFINHLELLEVLHGPQERVMPDNGKIPVVVGPTHPFDTVVDRSGRDVSATLAAADDHAFSTVRQRIATVTAGDSRDWIETVIPPIAGDTAAVVLRLRNSLLNTVLFYDHILGAQGAGALDWMARDIRRIDAAVELGEWYHRTMGLRLEVETADGFEEIARFGDTGPIAWSEVAFRVPTTPGTPTRIRLSFLADEWRIDRLGWSASITSPEVRTIPVAALEPLHGPPDPGLRGRVAEPDESYLVTSAGSGFVARFDVGPETHGRQRTFLLGSQGYYTEWIRPNWIRTAEPDSPFRPTPGLLPALMSHWLDVMDDIESDFFASRIAVR